MSEYGQPTPLLPRVPGQTFAGENVLWPRNDPDQVSIGCTDLSLMLRVLYGLNNLPTDQEGLIA
jgi:hypothetical protein